MGRREFIALMGASVAWPFAAMAQEPGRTYRLGFLAPFTRDVPFNVAFFDELRRLGFIEGQNLAIDLRVFVPRVDDFAICGGVGHSPTRCHLCWWGCCGSCRTAGNQEHPHRCDHRRYGWEGLVGSLARPDGNTTGISILATDLDGKRQDILIEAVPGIRRMAALADSSTFTEAKARSLQEAARVHNVELSIYRITRGEEIAAAIDKAQALGATTLNVFASPMLDGNRRLIMERVATLRLPAMYQWPERAEESGFAGYGPRLSELNVLCARLAAKLLRGAKPADLPIEQPTKFELVINLKTAKAMGLTVPEPLLVRADKVIE